MASYDNLMTEQLWSVRPALSDAWFSDLFTKETETFTKALQSSFAGASSNGEFYSSGIDESLFANTTPIQTPTVSGVSENDSLVSKKRRISAPPSGRGAKRKSRASKRAAMTTFIATDPENFMQMVQQVTGVSFEPPHPAAPASRTHWAADYGLTTLDTSAFLLHGGAASYEVSQPPAVEADDGGRAAEHYIDSFCSFPTLESWRAVE